MGGETRPFCGLQGLTIRSVVSSLGTFVRCDSNADAKQDIADAVWTLNELFYSGPQAPCREAGDCNDDGRVDVSDALFSIRFLFLGGPTPPAPFPECGADPDSSPVSCPPGSGGACS